MKFFSFINSLSNPEKTRNFNVFKNYSLHDFGMIVENCGLARSARKDDLGPVRISVVGTNGKGSVSHFLSEIALRNANFPGVGLYTSPHLVRPEERIRFNGKEITEMELDNLLRSFSPEQIFLLGKCSYFELFTIFSFCYFKEKNSSLEIYEAGLGGRLDSTKLATADYIVLTAIELDHMEVLGNSKDEILSEKLEIATERAKTIFAMPQDSENLNRQIEEFSVKNKIALRFFRKKRTTEGYLSYNKDFSWFILSIIADDYGWSFPPEKLNQILGEIQDPAGRMEILRKDPPLLFDIAHNAGAVQCLLGSTNLLFPERKITAIFGCLRDKDISGIGKVLENHSGIRKIFQIVDPDFSQEKPGLKSFTRIQTGDIPGIIESEAENLILVFGSFRLYTGLKKMFQNL